MSDQERLAVLSMDVLNIAEVDDFIVFNIDDASFIIKLAHEAIKNRNIQIQEQN